MLETIHEIDGSIIRRRVYWAPVKNESTEWAYSTKIKNENKERKYRMKV